MLPKYWVGQKVRLGFSVRCYGETRMNFLTKPILCTQGFVLFFTVLSYHLKKEENFEHAS